MSIARQIGNFPIRSMVDRGIWKGNPGRNIAGESA